MTSDSHDLIEVIDTIAKTRNIRICVEESFKGAMIAGACAFIGAVLGGPRGLAVGAATGGVAASIISEGKFMSLGDALRELEPAERRQLIGRIENVVANFGYGSIAAILPVLVNDQSIQDIVINEVTNFFSNVVGSQITQ